MNNVKLHVDIYFTIKPLGGKRRDLSRYSVKLLIWILEHKWLFCN